ncbi:hypothetical protein QBC41DRAFT_320515 [Cercophora samala]|uniref:Uncharacterized protein n=1 Tax=Cercophora samala TaxID=330535 RepID=A0AA39ZDQ1_9PEZI|nr:hypothetical protein QBC41DRAFT_320515 [Cercophora samala]
MSKGGTFSGTGAGPGHSSGFLGGIRWDFLSYWWIGLASIASFLLLSRVLERSFGNGFSGVACCLHSFTVWPLNP